MNNARSNIVRFPDNMFKPETITVNNIDDSEETYKLYMARFNNLYDLYDYLKSKPDINSAVFHELASVNGDMDWAGKPYVDAVEDLVSDSDQGYDEFFKICSEINSAKLGEIHKYRTIPTVAGGRVHIPSYAAGSPYCYTTEEKLYKPKFANLNVLLSYRASTSQSAVLSRALIIINLVKALEHAGYVINLNTFELSYNWDELIYIIVQLKGQNENLNLSSLYKSLCNVEFLRRILFRVLETMSVTNGWESGYGRTCSEDFTKKILNLEKNDIFFPEPYEMGINGVDFVSDFQNAIEYLKLEDIIDTSNLEEKFSSIKLKRF